MKPRTAFTATALIYAAALAYVLLRWDAIPDPVATHIGITGEPDAWRPKTFLSVTAVTWIGVAASLGIALCLPPVSLAGARREVAPTSTIPFSASAAQRTRVLAGQTHEMLGGVLVATAMLLAVTQVMIVFPDHIPFWLFGILFVAYMAAVIWVTARLLRSGKQLQAEIAADAEEEQRIARLNLKVSGMGTYNEPEDPMAACVLPTAPDKVQVNTAHPQAKGTSAAWLRALRFPSWRLC
ncbi:DUF1648 domain-containing protein [Corynebacterium aquatimens]|uniref:DUF1648 domain-containing protein n=1 Tax=Corynebacterium aquatimens TaxID=1190508 RepID=UPI002540F081|nr:DUF1648 domain-containing protein [Corynebacterium aquatimens]QYH19567.1 DUF1648 domain-containing protein [Corynebacterium aquatimens]